MTVHSAIGRAVLLTVMMTALAGCSSGPSGDFSQDIPLSERPSIADIIDRRGEEFLAMDGVVVIFEGATVAGEPCIKIGVAQLSEKLESILPRKIEGWPVVIFESGVIEPMDGR